MNADPCGLRIRIEENVHFVCKFSSQCSCKSRTRYTAFTHVQLSSALDPDRYLLDPNPAASQDPNPGG